MTERFLYSLGIVQNHPSQIDGPLYCLLHQDRRVALTVYYTDPAASGDAVDPELGIKPAWHDLATSGYTLRYLPCAGARGTRAAMAAICKEHHDLVIICGYMPFAHLLLSCLLHHRGVRLGLRSDTTLLHSRTQSGSARSILKPAFLRSVLAWYTTYHPVGTLARDYLVRYGAAPDRMFRFPYAVDNDRLVAACAAADRLRGRSQLGIPDDAFAVLGVLKFAEREDPITLVNGFQRLLAHNPNSRLVLVGDGPLRSRIESLAKGIDDAKVHLPGYVPYEQLPTYYAMADVFVHPARSEPWGVSVNEAMACGLPVVVSNMVGAHVDLVDQGRNGFVFPVGDADALAEQLRAVDLDRTSTRRFGKASRHIISKWGYESTIQSLLDALACAG